MDDDMAGESESQEPHVGPGDASDEEPTQPATQPIMDPRRFGRNNSGLSEQDLSDVICILHPISPAAVQVVAHLAQVAPQNILQNDDLLRRTQDEGNDAEAGLGSDDASLRQRDIALRMSSPLKDVCLGFSFGRSPQMNDIVLGHNFPSRRISAMHFRIYLKDEVIMLEDISTNGTSVDDVLLMSPRKNITPGQNVDYGRKRMLNPGSMVKLLSDVGAEEILFVVRIPSRHGYEDAYLNSLHEYLDRIDYEAYKRQQRAAQGQVGPTEPEPAQAQRQERQLQADTPRKAEPRQPEQPTPTAPNFFARRPAFSSRPRLPRAWDGGDRFKVIGHAGKGTFAIVYKIATYSNGELFAAKELDKRKFIRNGVLDQKLDNEMAIMKRLRHPNIVQYIDYIEEAPYMYIIMEFVSGGDLGTMISRRGFIDESLVKPMARQVLDALEYLHGQKITHRDIKPDNILLHSENPIQVKLSDFGLSKVIDNQETFLRTFCGTLLYCAPEVFARYPDYVSGRPMKRRRGERVHTQPHTYSQACDIWSFAAVLFMALSASPAFIVETGDKDLMLDKIMTTKLDVTPLIRRGVSSEGIAFIKQLLNPRPELRPTEEECLDDPWLFEPERTLKTKRKGLSVIDEGIEDTLDASQLSLNDNAHTTGLDNGEPEDDLDLDELAGPSTRRSKRHMRADAFAHREPPNIIPSSPDASMAEPSSPMQDDSDSFVPASPPSGRLFGEIRPSLIASSGVLPEDLNLGTPTDGDNNGGAAEESSLSDSRYRSALGQSHAYNNTFEQAAAGLLEGSHFSSNYFDPPSAASLFGAEALVGQLNVTSPPGERSAVSTPESPIDPRTPTSREPSPTSTTHRSKRASSEGKGKQLEEPADPAATSSAEVKSRPSERSQSVPPACSTHMAAQDKSSRSSAKTRALDSNSGIAEAALKCQTTSLPPTQNVSEVEPQKGTTTAAQRGRQAATQNGTANGHNDPSTTAAAEDGFARPLPVLGKLVTTPESFLSLTIALKARETSWGRSPNNTIMYTDGQDTRIPKYAFDILFWRKGLVDQIKRGADWRDIPEVPAIIKTRASRQIWVNGVQLVQRDIDGNPYGKLCTGDIITIFEAAGDSLGLLGGAPRSELKFVCEFYHGASVARRPAGAKPFEVQHAELGGSGGMSASASASASATMNPRSAQQEKQQQQYAASAATMA